MGSSMGSDLMMSTAAVLLLLVVVAEGCVIITGPQRRRGGGKYHNFRMDDCGRNRTCRELSRECKKMFFASMADNYVDAGDVEIITTVEKMAAIMEMLIEHQQNLTECAYKTGIELPNSGDKNPFTRNDGGGRRRGGGTNVGPRRGGSWRWLEGLGGEAVRSGREGRDTGFGQRRKGFGGGSKGHNGNFGVSEVEALELKKCLLNKKGLLKSDETLNREAFKAQISSAYDSQPGVQTSVEEAVDTCPEPKDYNIHGFVKCINRACIEIFELDDDEEDSPQGNP